LPGRPRAVLPPAPLPARDHPLGARRPRLTHRARPWIRLPRRRVPGPTSRQNPSPWSGTREPGTTQRRERPVTGGGGPRAPVVPRPRLCRHHHGGSLAVPLTGWPPIPRLLCQRVGTFDGSPTVALAPTARIHETFISLPEWHVGCTTAPPRRRPRTHSQRLTEEPTCTAPSYSPQPSSSARCPSRAVTSTRMTTTGTATARSEERRVGETGR